MRVISKAEALERLADRIGRLPPPSSRNPHAFHEERSEIEAIAHGIAEWDRTGRAPIDVIEKLEGR